MRSTVVFHVIGEINETVESDLPFNTLITLAREKTPLAGFDHLYIPKSILAVDLPEQLLELECELG